MAIQTRNKRSIQFSTASMSDLVFLLLIFFMLTSTLVAPNAIKLLLPQSSSKTLAKQTITVYINEKAEYFIGETKVTTDQLQPLLSSELSGQLEGSVVLRSDQTVAVQHVVNVIDAVNKINDKYSTKHKVIMATRPR
jgi:biopolymer transport protein ExbD